ncbi:hypothetical protein ACXHXI_005908, partial [Escherichia coli]
KTNNINDLVCLSEGHLMQLNFQNGWFSASFLTGGLTLCPVNRHVPKLKSFASHSSHLPVIVVAATQQPLTECELPDTF